eukprot:GHRR01017619.1.p3 GENE.GHRR01017619.1~~GHRR01017619.1.p3  ORF type:complete len:159 (+),score=37.89 GHRR01017619.1:2213-2689(+)
MKKYVSAMPQMKGFFSTFSTSCFSTLGFVFSPSDAALAMSLPCEQHKCAHHQANDAWCPHTPLPPHAFGKPTSGEGRSKATKIVGNVPHAPVCATLLAGKPGGQDTGAAGTTNTLAVDTAQEQAGEQTPVSTRQHRNTYLPQFRLCHPRFQCKVEDSI